MLYHSIPEKEKKLWKFTPNNVSDEIHNSQFTKKKKTIIELLYKKYTRKISHIYRYFAAKHKLHRRKGEAIRRRRTEKPSSSEFNARKWSLQTKCTTYPITQCTLDPIEKWSKGKKRKLSSITSPGAARSFRVSLRVLCARTESAFRDCGPAMQVFFRANEIATLRNRASSNVRMEGARSRPRRSGVASRRRLRSIDWRWTDARRSINKKNNQIVFIGSRTNSAGLLFFVSGGFKCVRWRCSLQVSGRFLDFLCRKLRFFEFIFGWNDYGRIFVVIFLGFANQIRHCLWWVLCKYMSAYNGMFSLSIRCLWRNFFGYWWDDPKIFINPEKNF